MHFLVLILAVKFPGTSTSHHPIQQQSDSAVISAASSAASSNSLECPPTLQEQPQAVIPQGNFSIKVDLLLISHGLRKPLALHLLASCVKNVAFVHKILAESLLVLTLVMQ